MDVFPSFVEDPGEREEADERHGERPLGVTDDREPGVTNALGKQRIACERSTQPVRHRVT